jgi:hypothetical protein
MLALPNQTRALLSATPHKAAAARPICVRPYFTCEQKRLFSSRQSTFGFPGVPIRFNLRKGDNPYRDKRGE